LHNKNHKGTTWIRIGEYACAFTKGFAKVIEKGTVDAIVGAVAMG
jgi:hypothetical protein